MSRMSRAARRVDALAAAGAGQSSEPGRAAARQASGPGRPVAPGRALRAQREGGGAGGRSPVRAPDSSTPTTAASSSAVGVPRTILMTGAGSMVAQHTALTPAVPWTGTVRCGTPPAVGE